MNRIFIFTGFDGILPLDDERHLQHCHPTDNSWILCGTFQRHPNILLLLPCYNICSTKVIYTFTQATSTNMLSECSSLWPVHHTPTIGSYSMPTKVEVSICPMGTAMRLQRSVIGVKFLRSIASPIMLYLAPWATVTLPFTFVISLCRPNRYQHGRYHRFHDRESVISITGDVC